MEEKKVTEEKEFQINFITGPSRLLYYDFYLIGSFVYDSTAGQGLSSSYPNHSTGSLLEAINLVNKIFVECFRFSLSTSKS